MNVFAKIFKSELLNCIDDMIGIMETSFKDDAYAVKLVGELRFAKTIIVPLEEKGVVEILETFRNCTLSLKEKIAARDKNFFESITICPFCTDSKSTESCICHDKCSDECTCSETCIYCSDILTEMDSKTFKAIKMVMKKGDQEDVDVAFDYLDCFMVTCEKYHLDTKEKLN